MLRPKRSNLVLLATLLCGCTPFGFWIYDDPQVMLSRLAVRPGNQADLPYEFVVVVINCNDYDLTGTSLDLTLRTGGESRTLSYTTAFTVRNLESTNVKVPVALSPDSVLIFRDALTSVGDDVEVAGRLQVTTPIGRREVTFTRRGALTVAEVDTGSSNTSALRWVPGYGHFCVRHRAGPGDLFGGQTGKPIDNRSMAPVPFLHP
jgi:hypothetical protein